MRIRTIDDYWMKERQSCVAYYPFVPKSELKAVDLSRFGNHAPITGAAYEGTRGASHLKFDGVDDWMNLGQPSQLQDLENLSISCWLQMAVEPFAGRIVTKWNAGVSEGWFFRLNPVLGLQFRTKFDAGDGIYVTNETPDWTARFYHLAVSVSSRQSVADIGVSLYVDGTQIPTVVNAAPSGSYVTEAVDCIIGSQSPPPLAVLSGRLADVQIHNIALRPDEIREIYEDSYQFYGSP